MLLSNSYARNNGIWMATIFESATPRFFNFSFCIYTKKIFIYVITYCLRQEIKVIDILALLKYFYEETLIGI